MTNIVTRKGRRGRPVRGWWGVTALVLLPAAVLGQAKVGTTGLQFLKVGVGARAVGMGGTFTAVANDASALAYNPAGLIQLTRPEAIFTLVDYPAGLTFIHFGGAVPYPRTSGVFGVQFTSLSSDEMVETTPEMPYGTGRTFTAGDVMAGLSYCQRLTDKFSVGVNAKVLHERLADAQATGWAADVGTFYTTGWKRINIGMVIQNFGPDLTFESAPFPLPITFKFGASMVAWRTAQYELLVAGEFAHPNDNLELYSLGTEFTVMRMFSFRAGKRMNGWVRDEWTDWVVDTQKDPFVEYPILEKDGGRTRVSWDGFSAGMGFNVPTAGVKVDYALDQLGTLGQVHRFTVGYSLAGLF